MASPERIAADALALLDELRRAPYRFDFFQLLRLLECAYLDFPRIGESLHPSDDAVRFAQEPSLNFPPATVAGLERGANGRPPRLIQRAIGLFGPNGPLPLHLTDFARERIYSHKDPTFARFADIFHHRMVSLFYRAWAQAEPAVQFDRVESDGFARYIGSLIGLGPQVFRERDAMPDTLKFHFAGRMACQTRNAEGLEILLETYFKMPVEVHQFAGDWLELPENCRSQLGNHSSTMTLGQSVLLGRRIWDCQHKFRMVLGPMDFEQYERLLPNGQNLPVLIAVIKNYVGIELDWDAALILKKEQVPPIQLGQRGQLGRTSWLASRCRDRDVEDYNLKSTALTN